MKEGGHEENRTDARTPVLVSPPENMEGIAPLWPLRKSTREKAGWVFSQTPAPCNGVQQMADLKDLVDERRLSLHEFEAQMPQLYETIL